MNCQGKSGIFREFSIFFIHVREKSGEKSYLISISISLTIGMIVREVVVLIVVSKYEILSFSTVEYI